MAKLVRGFRDIFEPQSQHFTELYRGTERIIR